MTPVGGSVRLGTPSTCVEMVIYIYIHGSSKHNNFTLDGPVILSRLCDSKLWIIKYTENPLDTNIPMIKKTVRIINNVMQLLKWSKQQSTFCSVVIAAIDSA